MGCVTPAEEEVFTSRLHVTSAMLATRIASLANTASETLLTARQLHTKDSHTIETCCGN